MKVCLIGLLVMVLAAWSPAQTTMPAAAPTTAPTTAPAGMAELRDEDLDAFSEKVDLSEFRLLSIQDDQTIKTFDTYARQLLQTVTGSSSYEGRSAAFTVLDIHARPEVYVHKNIIRVRNAPLCADIAAFKGFSDAERERFKKEKTVSAAFLASPEVRQFFVGLQNQAVFKSEAMGELFHAQSVLTDVMSDRDLNQWNIVPPASGADRKWHNLGEFFPWAAEVRENAAAVAPIPEYATRAPSIYDAAKAFLDLTIAWRSGDAEATNLALHAMSNAVPAISPEVYPSPFKRSLEIVYNRFARLTPVAAALYFIACVLFLTGARAGVGRLRVWGLRFALLAILVHTLAIAVRWTLIEKSVGNWFEAIPIKNMFESVMMSAWFGVLVGLVLEFRKGRGLFGAAAAFVGCMAMIALFTVPYFVPDIGADIKQVNGVLMSYWLYIHVTLVTASYSLIGMGFLLSAWWLVRYYSNFGTFSRHGMGRMLSADVVRDDQMTPAMLGHSGAAVVRAGWMDTLARVFFFPVKRSAIVVANRDVALDDAQFLPRLDQANLVILQLAFWVLGVGIVCGAVWADMSWGRPWGWDAKETFALITWIVYLVVVHVRVATADKAWWTAVLSFVGFFVMLFNWIGVNFFLAGLHSYAS